jgi:hypothetical protein
MPRLRRRRRSLPQMVTQISIILPKRLRLPSLSAIKLTKNQPLIALSGTRSLAPLIGNVMTSVLTRTVTTDDNTLSGSYLGIPDSETILNTVRELASPKALTLLPELPECLPRNPGRAGSPGDPMRCMSATHSRHLVTYPHLVHTVSSLYATLNTQPFDRAYLRWNVSSECSMPKWNYEKHRGPPQPQALPPIRMRCSSNTGRLKARPNMNRVTTNRELRLEGGQIEDARSTKFPAAFGDDEERAGRSVELGFTSPGW